jgi:predicted kinase
MPGEPEIHLMCGLVGAGKTTLALQLARQLPAVRLSRDEWMLRLYGSRHDDPVYIARLVPCTELMWDVSLATVTAGSSVVLDWNFWSRERRREARQRGRHSRRRPRVALARHLGRDRRGAGRAVDWMTGQQS